MRPHTPLLLALLACRPAEEPGETGAGDDGWRYGPYEATIRWTAWGVPHVEAEDWGSLGFGAMLAMSRDHGCTLADQFVRARSERARYFGRGEDDRYVDEDFAWKALGVMDTAKAGFSELPGELRDLLVGATAGYNRWVESEPHPPACDGAEWVFPVEPTDLLAYFLTLGEMASGGELLVEIGSGQPPGARRRPPPVPDHLAVLRHPPIGSNGWALGGDRTDDGRGTVLSNTHFPYSGERRWFEQHLVIPGTLDVYGASLIGVPLVNVGFNEHLAWTHTVSTTPRFTLYQLSLDPDDPTRYLYDGAYEAMEPHEYAIEVLGEDGSIATETRTLYTSRYGPVLNAPVVGWSDSLAIALRDANQGNLAMLPTWWAMNLADDAESFEAAHRDWNGIPWVHTLMATADGTAWYADSASTPDLSPEAVAAWEASLEDNALAAMLAGYGLYLLDGSDPRFAWVEDANPARPGLVPFDEAPRLVTSTYVFNANDNHWLTNVDEPLEGYPAIYGEERSPRTPRTRMNARYLTETGEEAASGPDGLFDLDEVEAAVLDGRGIVAEELRDAVVAAAREAGTATVSGPDGTRTVDLAALADVLEAWDGRVSTASAGAALWREMLGDSAFSSDDFYDAGALFAEGFDPEDPVDTPRGLAEDAGPVIQALAEGAVRLEDGGWSPDTPLGDMQFQYRGDAAWPVLGGQAREGTIAVATWSDWGNATLLDRPERPEVLHESTGLTVDGYAVNYGNSYILAVHFAEDGPRARAVMVYAQSEDPGSDHYDDQSAWYAEHGLREVRFTEADSLAAPDLVEESASLP